MYEYGVASTSIEDVQAAAAVSASQINYYSGDKHGLVRAVIGHQCESVLGVQTPLLVNLDSVEALEAWRDVVVGIHRDGRNQQGCPMGSLTSELSRSDPERGPTSSPASTAGRERCGTASTRCGSAANCPTGSIPTASPSRCSPPSRAAWCSPRPAATPSRSKRPWTP
jgi:AcrR family transcriptional regulator